MCIIPYGNRHSHFPCGNNLLLSWHPSYYIVVFFYSPSPKTVSYYISNSHASFLSSFPVSYFPINFHIFHFLPLTCIFSPFYRNHFFCTIYGTYFISCLITDTIAMQIFPYFRDSSIWALKNCLFSSSILACYLLL